MADISNRRVRAKAAIRPYKLALVTRQTFKNPLLAEITNALCTMDKDNDVSSGAASITLGGWSKTQTDVHRTVNVVCHAPTGSYITGGGFTLVYDDCQGHERTVQVTGFTADGADVRETILETPGGVDEVKTIDIGIAGPTLTAIVAGVGMGPKLCIGSEVQNHCKIVRETGQPTPPDLEAPYGVFTPGTTLDGSTPVDVVVNFGA